MTNVKDIVMESALRNDLKGFQLKGIQRNNVFIKQVQTYLKSN